MVQRKKQNKKINFSAHQKNLDNMKLLTSDNEFLKIVTEARAFLHIPLQGIANDKDVEQWHVTMDNRSDEVMSSLEFLKQRKLIQEKLAKGETDEHMAKKQFRLLQHKIPWNHLWNTIQYIIDTFHIPQHYSEYIQHFLITSQVTAPVNNFTTELRPHINRVSDTKYLAINVYAQLDNKELKDLKHELNSIIGKNLPKFTRLTDIDKKLDMEKWFENRERFDEVENKTYKMTAEEIAENVLSNPKKKQAVYDSHRELEDHRQKRFRKSENS